MRTNYIHQLEDQVTELAAQRTALEGRFQAMREHLARPKFAAVQPDGSRGDWIAIADVQRWLRYLENGDLC